MVTRRAVEDGIFSLTSDGPRLLGSRCRLCGTHAFPVQDSCARCTATSMEPQRFVPFGVGYVELPGQLKVEARLTVSDPARLEIGMDMFLVLVPLTTDDDGTEVVTFGFAPVEEATR